MISFCCVLSPFFQGGAVCETPLHLKDTPSPISVFLSFLINSYLPMLFHIFFLAYLVVSDTVHTLCYMII